eukprot:5680812-Amphidinium_carterae.1
MCDYPCREQASISWLLLVLGETSSEKVIANVSQRACCAGFLGRGWLLPRTDINTKAFEDSRGSQAVCAHFDHYVVSVQASKMEDPGIQRCTGQLWVHDWSYQDAESKYLSCLA